MPSEKSSSEETPEFISRQVSESDYFFLDLNPARSSKFTVTCGGLEFCNENYRIDRKEFDYFGIEYIVSGSCSLVLDGKTYQLKAGSIFCYGPRTRHQIRNTGDVPLIKFFVDFTGTDVRKVIGVPFLSAPVAYQMPNLKSMHALFQQIQEVGKQGGRGCQAILRQLVELIALLTKFKAIDVNDFGVGSYVTYARCLSHIEQNYPEIKSVEQLAKSCHISSAHLSRIFRKFGGESPWQMVTRLKMNRAGELLIRDQLMVKEVAIQIGFEDAYHFSRVFKEYYGMSPRGFRESLKNASL